MRVFLLFLCVFVAFGFWTAPDRKAASLSSPFRVGDRSTNLLYLVATRGFDVVRVADGQAEYVRGDKRGQQTNYFSATLYPYGDKIKDVCQGERCVFFAAKRIDWPMGSNFKLRHIYEIGWVERDGILQAVGADNLMYFYPLK